MARPGWHASKLMVDILKVAATRSGGVSVRELVAVAQSGGRSQSVARATVSRALRRLWSQDAVELHGLWTRSAGSTMTERRQRRQEIAATAQANPEPVYNEALRFFALFRKHGYDPWGSADAYVAAKVREAKELPRLRVLVVTITKAGQALLDHRLTQPPAGELTDEAPSSRAAR